jgi:Peptidase M60, enhancin and enhancin-like/N-terminal domain of M60-like peptidases
MKPAARVPMHTLRKFFGQRVIQSALGIVAFSACLVSCGGGSGSGSAVDPASGGTSGTTPSGTTSAFGLEGFTQCGSEGGSVDLAVKTHLAYGANNAFVYLFNQIGKVSLNSNTFGSDPIFGTGKLVYCKPVVDGADALTFSAALAKIKGHITGGAVLDAAQINAQAGLLAASMFTLAGSEATLAEALAVIDLYEKKEGVFFIGAKTKGGFPNKPGALDGLELARAVFTLQQGIHDQAFTPTGFAKYRTLLGGKKFATADFYPGKVKIAADPTKSYVAKINASMPKFVGKPTAFSSTPAVRPTGYYLAAGDVATVTVPTSMVGKGFTIQVGAHKQDKTGSGPVRRFFRISNKFPIDSVTTEVANPFGGGIYINTPYLADAGIVDVQIKNVVPAPFFSATAHHKTTLAEWVATQRNNPAPWADFESDKFMMQVPTSFIYNYADPVELMRHWDMRMDGVSELIGQPLVRNNVILYIQIDTDIMFSGYGIGYPAINNTFDPSAATDGNQKAWYLNASSDFWETEFHELGHAQLFSNFPGEGEAEVNLLAAAIWNRKYALDLDLAFGKSFLNLAQINREQAALNWMVTPNFRAGKAMDISNTTKDEVRYQHRGYAKYVEIAALFGWSALDNFYKQENLDYTTPVASDGLSGVDSRIFRMSKAAGADLTPLIHFWGVQPVDSALLGKAMSAAGLKPSAAIYDRLIKYRSIIPLDNAAFTAHAKVFLNKSVITAGASPDYGEGWYFVWLPLYDASHGTAAQAAMAAILQKYFPGGRP